MSILNFGRRALQEAVDYAGKKIGALSDLGDTPSPAPLSMYDAPAGSKPEYRGAAPDRSDLTYLRYKPAKGYSERVQTSLEALRDPENPVRAELLKDIRRGEEIGGNDWYNTEELRDWFVGELGEAQGDAEWREFLYLMGTTSPGSNVPMNMASASATRGRFFNDPEYVDQLLNVENLKDAQAKRDELSSKMGSVDVTTGTGANKKTVTVKTVAQKDKEARDRQPNKDPRNTSTNTRTNYGTTPKVKGTSGNESFSSKVKRGGGFAKGGLMKKKKK